MSTNISDNYSITNHSTNLSERFKSVTSAGTAATVDLIAQSSFASFFDGGTFTLIDTAGTSKTYLFDDDNTDGATGDISGGSIVIQINGLADIDDFATQMAAAISSVNGHNGTITATASGGASGKVVLVQATGGAAGNSSIGNTTDPGALSISYLAGSVTSFQNGADGVITSGSLDIMPFRNGINGATSIRFQGTSNYYQTFIGEQRH